MVSFSVAWLVVAVMVGFVIVPAVIATFWFFLSHRYRVDIARQTGTDPNDVVWIKDKFKVIEKGGQHIIKFLWQKQRSQSFPYKFWTKTSGKKWKMTQEEWNRKDLSKHIRRGLKLYQTTEGEYHPIVFKKDGEFTVLPQDNRAFIVNQYEHVNELMITKKQLYVMYGALVVLLLVMVISFVLYLVYLNESQAIATAQNSAPVLTNQFLEGAQSVVGG